MNSKSKPSVTIIVSHLAPVFGMEKVALAVIKMLRKEYDVRVVCIGGNYSDLVEAPGAMLLGGPLRGFNRIQSLWRLRKFARSLHNDVVITVGVWVAVPWLLVSSPSRCRTIVWEHSMMASRVRHSRQLKLLAVASRLLYRRSRKVVAVSRPLENDIAAMCPGASVTTIPNPVDAPAAPAGSQRRNPTLSPTTRLLTVGSLTGVKEQHRVIQALPLLDDSYRLTVVGSGPERQRLQSLADRLEVGDRVTFEGYLPAEEVEKRMMNADLLIHCAVVETFGLVYVEAADAGLPVISTRNPVAEEMIPTYVPGWISESDPESLARLIEKHKSADLFNEAKKAESRRRDEFSSDHVLAKWTALIGSLSVLEGNRCR